MDGSFNREDKMTGAHNVRFELVANNYFREDPNYPPRVDLFLREWQSSGWPISIPGSDFLHPIDPGFWVSLNWK